MAETCINQKTLKAGYTIPDSQSKSSGLPVCQEVVKLDLVESENSSSAMVEQKVSHQILSGVPCIAAESECGIIRVRLFNGADTSVVRDALECIGGMSYAW